MFGTKIRSWMEAHIARSRAKKKERKSASQPAVLQQHQHDYAARACFDPAFFGATADFNEILPALPISNFKPRVEEARHHRHHAVQPQQQQQQQQQTRSDKPQQQYGNKGAGSAVNLSSPESAYSTGYSTDGTSPCATYAPEYYINVRTQQQQQQPAPAMVQQYRHAETSTQTRLRGRLEVERIEEPARREPRAKEPLLRHARDTERIENRGTYSVSATRSRFLEGSKEYEHHPWRKPAPPLTSRPTTQASSPKIQAGHLMRKPYSTPVVTDCGDGYSTSYPLQLFSPRRMPLVATTTTQVMPVKSPRQRSRVRTNPWPGRSGNVQTTAATGTPARPWSRQQRGYDNGSLDYNCCRQESLSVGRSPVNRSDWRSSAQLRQQHRLRGKPSARSSSASSCSSRSCSLSSGSNSSNPSSPSSDDVTLNEVMGKFDENYVYEKETDIVSDHSERLDNSYSSANFSSDASASSLELAIEAGSRSASRQQQLRLSGRRQRRRRHRRSSAESRTNDEEEHREEVELLQDVLNRRLKKNNSEAAAQTNRALLERLLMKNELGSRRAWNPAPMRPAAAASRSVGGTPICLRRRAPRNVLSPPSKLAFERNHQVYPAESTSSLKNMSASELALIEADKEADLKYAQLIMEAERMLLNVQQQLDHEESTSNSHRGSSTSIAAENSPSRLPRRLYQLQQQQFPQQQQICTGSAPNKRVELIKNAELNIELALLRSRNSQPELSSGSIKDLLDHSSPKRLLKQQQKKMIEPVISQTVASTQTTETNSTVFPTIDVNSPAILKNAGQDEELCSTSEHYSCPQSEPVKRKVYVEGQDGCNRPLQRQPPSWLRNSDGDCAANDQQQPQLQSASAASSYSQLRKHMLIETLQGLKQSLEDQSAALKLNCLRPL